VREVRVLEDRKLDVLRAIVEDYVSTQEPVGSKALVERHNLGVSPATIRNDMAALEDEGYIAQPHTSAGRIPTDKGYRLFVDRLSTVKPLSTAERRAIQSFLDGALDLDDIVTRTVRLLAQLTHQVAVVQYPSLSRSSVRHVELVPLTSTRLLVVLITTTGRVEQRVVETVTEVPDDLLFELRAQLNAATVGQRLADAAGRLAGLPDRFTVENRTAVQAVLSSSAARPTWLAWARTSR
jgi:heat-inducible transcriptional repressor